jgi:hypothetical protein
MAGVDNIADLMDGGVLATASGGSGGCRQPFQQQHLPVDVKSLAGDRRGPWDWLEDTISRQFACNFAP